MLEKPISDTDRVPDVFELSRRVNEPFQKRAKRMSSCSPPNSQLEEFFKDDSEMQPFEKRLVEPQPTPTKNDLPYMWPKAMERFAKLAKARDDFGVKKYGSRIQPFNGRNPITDALQELLDAFVYFEQIIFESEYKDTIVKAAEDIVNHGTLDKDFQERLGTLFQAVWKLKEIRGS
jgi:hypothetical protein